MVFNQHGVKDCSDCYLMIKGVRFVQWTDDGDLDIEVERRMSPMFKFIKRGYRIYRSAEAVK